VRILADMQARLPRAGVCIVRIEPQPEHLLITVSTSRNIADTVYPARSERVRQFADPDEALPYVAEFLRSFSPLAQPG
jgi:hypothetical protein